MDVEYMRSVVKKAYPGVSWKARVANMSDAQVMAIYFRMMSQPDKAGRLSQPKTERRKAHV